MWEHQQGRLGKLCPRHPSWPGPGAGRPPDGQQGGWAQPGPARSRPAGLTPGPGDPGSLWDKRRRLHNTKHVLSQSHSGPPSTLVRQPGFRRPPRERVCRQTRVCFSVALKLKFPEPYNETYVKLISGAQWSLKWIHNEVHLRGVYRGLEGLIKEVPFLPLTLISWLWHISSRTTHNLRDDMLSQLLHVQNVTEWKLSIAALLSSLLANWASTMCTRIWETKRELLCWRFIF